MIILEKKNLTNYPIPCQPLAILPALKKTLSFSQNI